MQSHQRQAQSKRRPSFLSPKGKDLSHKDKHYLITPNVLRILSLEMICALLLFRPTVLKQLKQRLKKSEIMSQ